MSRFVIIDGHAVVHRAYHSMPPLTHNGFPVNALYGFYSMLLTALQTLKPDYLAVCLDSPGPNFRNAEFIGYRAKRKPADHDLISQLPLIKDSLETANIPTFAMGGYEADDLIATLCRRALKKLIKNPKTNKIKKIDQITIITGDKDLMQLVNDKTELFMPIRGLSDTKVFKSADVKEKLGVSPAQVVDLKALMGDMSDNYPGVAGIGPKVAVDLLNQYQNLDTLYRHLDDLKPSLKEKLTKDKDNAYLSYKLATLVANIPLNFSLKSTRWNQKRALGLLNLFKTYNFKSLVSRLQKQYQLKPVTSSKKPDSNQTSFF